MPLIRSHGDPANITKPEVSEIKPGTVLIDWLVYKFGDASNVANGLPFDVVLNGKCISSWSDESDLSEDPLNITLGEKDEVAIIARPGDAGSLIYIVVAVVAAAVAIALAPTIPGDAGQGKTSPNNDLQAATNSFRPGEAIPNLYGEQISYPDFIQPSNFEYVNNLKIVRELFCIGEGGHNVSEVKSESTLIDDIPEWSYQIFQPGSLPPLSTTQIHTGTDQVDGQVLLASDSSEFFEENGVASVVVDVPLPGEEQENTVIEMDGGSTFIQDTGIERGDHIDVLIIGGNPQNPTTLLQGVYLVDSVDSTSITIASTDGSSGVAITSQTTKVNSDGDVENWIGWFNIRGGSNVENIWFHWQMPRGIRSSGGGDLTVSVEFQIEQIDDDGNPLGNPVSVIDTKTGNDVNAQFVTTKYQPTSAGRYRARARLASSFAGDNALAEVKVEDFVGIYGYSPENFGNVTLLYVERRATTFAVSQSSSKINCMAQSLIPTYNRVTGQYERDNLQPSRSFADAVSHMILGKTERPDSVIDLQELYSIADNIGVINGSGEHDPQLAYFDFTFDDFDVSLGERVRTACNAARVAAYRDGAVWRFVRDEKKPFRVAMFNRRSMTDRDADMNIQLVKVSDNDSLALTYVDPDTNTERVIYRRVDYSSQTIVNGELGNYPSEINLSGCRNETQAINRADLEIRRIAYQRVTVNDTVTRDGLLVGMQQRVGWVDPNDSTIVGGEILGRSGLNFDTTERFPLDRSKSYFVYVTDSDGEPSRTASCSPRDDTEFGFSAAGLNDAFAVETLGQAGSRYFIGTDDDIEAGDYLVNKRQPNQDGSVTLELLEYAERMYEMD